MAAGAPGGRVIVPIYSLDPPFLKHLGQTCPIEPPGSSRTPTYPSVAYVTRDMCVNDYRGEVPGRLGRAFSIAAAGLCFRLHRWTLGHAAPLNCRLRRMRCLQLSDRRYWMR